MLYEIADKKNNRLAALKTWLICAILVCIIFSLLVPCSICIIFLTGVWFFEGNLRKKWRLLRKDNLFVAYSLYFLTQLAGIFYANDIVTGWKNVETKLGFLVLPLIFCSSDFVNSRIRRWILTTTCITLTIASLYCFLNAILQYSHDHDGSDFFYHKLLHPIDQHAVYFSVYVFIGIIFLWWDGQQLGWIKKFPWVRIAWIAYFVILIYFLASKLVITFLVIYFAVTLAGSLLKRPAKWQVLTLLFIGLIGIVSLFTFNTPVRQRFSDLLNFNRASLYKEKFNAGDYFNGVEFRLLLWPVSIELLRDNHAFVFGVGSSNTQSLLAKKFLDMSMYSGNKSGNDHGYLDYNCHNQFLQISLQSGVIGLLVFLFWCLTIIRMTWQRNDNILSGMVMMIFIFFLTESVFEREFGMILCTIMPLIYLYPRKK